MISQAHVVDIYKQGHSEQYVNGTSMVYSNMTPRSNKLANIIRETNDGKVVLFGIQYAIKVMRENWDKTFFDQPKDQAMKKYIRRVKNAVGYDHGDFQIGCMSNLHDLGYLPLEVKALPEGSLVNMQIPIFTVKNTHPDFWWLTNYVETYLSATVWTMCSAASVSRQYYETSKRWADATGAPAEWLGIANHCFAARGHRGMEDAMMSGMGHLLFSYGTDTLWSIDGMEDYYNADSDKELVGVSVNAFEHATATQRIAYYRDKLNYNRHPLEAEIASVKDVLTNLYPSGIVSYVMDSEDYFGMLEYGLPTLKEEILARTEDSLGLCKFVVRPDSSPKTPLEVICGDPEADGGSAENLGTLQSLWDTFGGTLNDKGFKVINPKVGIIYGEAINAQMQEDIYRIMEQQGWCVSNLLMGVGSWGFIGNNSRDSYSFALKGSHSVINGEEVSMQKNPKTAQGSKKSAKGLLKVTQDPDGNFILHDQQTPEQEDQGELKTVFMDGEILNETSLTEIRNRLWGE